MKTVYENNEETIVIEKTKKGYYGQTEKYDTEFSTKKEMNEFIKKYNFKYVGTE